MARRAFCSTSNIVVPMAPRPAMISKISETRIGASPRLGSSRSSRRGRLMSARAMASICCSPPESVPADCLRRSERRGNNSNMRSMSLAIAARSLRTYAPSSRLSPTLWRASTCRPSGEWAMPRRTSTSGGKPVTSRPSKRSTPARGATSLDTARKMDVLPAPLAPISVTISPAATDRDTSRTAETAP